jgi:hypothetical protein
MIQMKRYIFSSLLLLLLILGCSKNERSNEPAAPNPLQTAPTPPPLTPSETVMKVGDALSRHDSATYVNLVSASRKRAYWMSPQLLSRTLAFWSLHKPTIQIVSESQHDSVAIVKYHLRISGTHPVDVTDSTELFLENGAWKYAR